MGAGTPNVEATSAREAWSRHDFVAAALHFLNAERGSDSDEYRLVYRAKAAGCSLQAGNYDQAMKLLADPESAQKAATEPLVAFHWFSTRAAAETELGHWHAAEQDLDTATGAADPQGLAYCFEIRARIAARRGQYTRAISLLKDGAIPAYTTVPLSPEFTSTAKAGKIADCVMSIARALLEIANTEQSITVAEVQFADALHRYAKLPDRQADVVRAQLGRVRCAARRAASSRGGARRRWRTAARTLLAEISSPTTELNGDLLTADLDLLTGHLWLLDALDPATSDSTAQLDNAEHAFNRAAASYGTHARQSAGCTLSRGNVQAARGELETARRMYDSALAAFREIGALDWTARTALAVANLDATDGKYDDALATALPAVLYLDARRFSLPTAAARASYRHVVEDGLAIAFRSAQELPNGDSAIVIAQLIETVINSGIHNTHRTDTDDTRQDPSSAIPLLHDDMNSEVHAFDRPGSRTHPQDDYASIATFFDTTLALPLLPPPLLRMPGPSNAIVFHDHIKSANRQYEPVARAAGVLPVV